MTALTVIPSSGAALPPRRASRHCFGGAWRDSRSGETFDRRPPSHGIVVSRSASGGGAEIAAAIAAARAAFDDGRWSRLAGKARVGVLLKVADLIEAQAERLALFEALETGKPISQAKGEVAGAADLWRHAAALARTVQGDSHNAPGDDILVVVMKEPVGAGVTPGMAIARDEVFGPVLAVLTFRTLEGAVVLVNDADYGLRAGVWSRDVHTCGAFARAARAGTVWTNTWMDGFPEVTFGGMRQSGQGREIGRCRFEEFLEVKSLVMRSGRTRTPWVKGA